MLTFAEIEQKFKAQALEDNWRASLAESGLPGADQDSIRTELNDSWSEFSEAARVADNEKELQKAVANRYIELKSHWNLLNAQIQYRMFIDGAGDDRLAYRASLLSSLVAFFGEFLSTDEIAVINRFLADPLRGELREFMQKLDNVSTAVASQTSLEEQLKDLYEEKEFLRSELGVGNCRQVIGMLRSFEEQLADLNLERENLRKGLGVSGTEDVLMLVGSMEDQLKDLYEDMENAIIVDGKKVTIVGPKKIIVRKKK